MFLLANLLEEMVHQNREVIGPLAQWRKRNRHHIQTIIQILTELPFLHHFPQIAACRSEDAHFHLAIFVAADWRNRQCLQYTQKLGLQTEFKIADLIDEQCPPVRLFESPDTPVGSAGERTPNMTK